MAAVSEGSTFKIDWDAIEEMSRTVGGGSDQVDWDLPGVSEEEGKNLFGWAVDGVRGFLQKLHFPRLERGQAEAAPVAVEPEPEEAGRNRFFGWLGEQKQRFDEWRKQPLFGEQEEGTATVAVAPGAPEAEVDRFGWLKNGWKWLAGLPGGIVGRFRRQPEGGAAPQISREERVKALKEGTKQFVEQHGLSLVGGLVGIAGVGVGAMVVSPENVGWTNAFIMELSSLGVAATSMLGFAIGDERGPGFIPEAEKAYQRPIRALQRLCSQKAVRRGLQLTSMFSVGFAGGGVARMAIERLQEFQQAAAGAPAPTEMATGNLSSVWSPEPGAAADWETRRQAVEQLTQSAGQLVTEPTIQAIQDMVGQSEAAFAQANQALSAISPDLSGNSSVSPLVDSAQQALRSANQFYTDAMASGGIDATEAAKLQDLARQAQAAVDAAVNTANQIAQQAADAAAAQNAARQAAETLASTPVAEIGKNLAGGTVWGNEIAFAQQLGLDHAVPVANAMKNFAYAFGQSQPFTGIGPESSVNLLNRDVATWLAGQLNGIIGKDPATLNSFQKMIWEIGYAGRQASVADLTQLAKEYAASMVAG